MDIATGEFLGFLNLTWQAVAMLVIGGVLVWLGIAKKVEPVLLVPIGFGCILANIPLGGAAEAGGFLAVLREAGIHTEIFPLLIFIGIGAMIDFEPFSTKALYHSSWCCRPIRHFRNFLLGLFVG